jgi:hypothetical protein
MTPCPQWQKDVCIHYSVGWFDYFLIGDNKAYKKITISIDYLYTIIKSRYNFGEGDVFLNETAYFLKNK